MPSRYIIYPILILLTLITLYLPTFLLNPKRNFSQLTKTSLQNKKTVRSFSSFFTKLPRGYIITLYTGKDSDFSPTEYLTITKLGNRLYVDLVNGPGPNNVIQLKDIQASAYLKEHGLSLMEFDKLVK